MSRFKPQVTFTTDEGIRQYNNGERKTRSDVNVYPSYARLRYSLQAVLNASFDEFATVVRSRRGEWGEWYEHWILVNGKPKKIREGWN